MCSEVRTPKACTPTANPYLDALQRHIQQLQFELGLDGEYSDRVCRGTYDSVPCWLSCHMTSSRAGWAALPIECPIFVFFLWPGAPCHPCLCPCLCLWLVSCSVCAPVLFLPSRSRCVAPARMRLCVHFGVAAARLRPPWQCVSCWRLLSPEAGSLAYLSILKADR